MRYLIGIDDTDDLAGPGTGNRARTLGEQLHAAQMAEAESITRHQLLVSPHIKYTSHNSSACLLVETAEDKQDALVDFCREFLLQESAESADAGLCIAKDADLTMEVVEFGRSAKQRVMTVQAALAVSDGLVVCLEGMTGDGSGIIGALAAVGLRKSGCDGRFLWLPELRQLKGFYSVDQLQREAHIDLVQDEHGNNVKADILIDVGDWVRPILQDGRAILLVEEVENGWRVISKEQIKAISH